MGRYADSIQELNPIRGAPIRSFSHRRVLLLPLLPIAQVLMHVLSRISFKPAILENQVKKLLSTLRAESLPVRSHEVPSWCMPDGLGFIAELVVVAGKARDGSDL